jgi:hypothetical protein
VVVASMGSLTGQVWLKPLAAQAGPPPVAAQKTFLLIPAPTTVLATRPCAASTGSPGSLRGVYPPAAMPAQ